MVDQRPKWINHIAHVTLKVAHGFGIINKAKHFFNKKMPQEPMMMFALRISNTWNSL